MKIKNKLASKVFFTAFIVILIASSLFVGVNGGELVSYPVSYHSNSVNDESYSIDLPNELTKAEYKFKFYEKDTYTHYKLKKIIDGMQDLDIQIISIDASNSSDAKNLLERFILSTHGVADIKQFRPIKIQNYDGYQIVYNLHTDQRGRYYDVYTAFKKGNLGVIFEMNYISILDEDDLFDTKDDIAQKIYKKILNTFKLKDVKPKSMKLKNDSDFDKELLKLQYRLNTNFKSTIKNEEL